MPPCSLIILFTICGRGWRDSLSIFLLHYFHFWGLWTIKLFPQFAITGVMYISIRTLQSSGFLAFLVDLWCFQGMFPWGLDFWRSWGRFAWCRRWIFLLIQRERVPFFLISPSVIIFLWWRRVEMSYFNCWGPTIFQVAPKEWMTLRDFMLEWWRG